MVLLVTIPFGGEVAWRHSSDGFRAGVHTAFMMMKVA
jgi:hypothetical protein